MDYEYNILAKKGIKVYNIPPMSSNQGHFLDSWKNKITEVNVKIMGKGHKCIIYLHNYDGSLFASAVLPEKYDQAVVKCTDSSRGYALKLQDPSGKTAWVGIVFTERNDSFDFQAALQDFEKTRDMELNPQKYAAENKPTQNFSLKQGEKISFNLGGDTGFNKPKPSSNFGDFKLAPPPGSGGSSFGLPPPGTSFNLPAPGTQSKPVQSQPQSQPQPQSNNFNDFSNFSNFDNFSNFNNNSNSNQGFSSGFGNNAQQTQNKNNFDLLGDVNFSSGSNSGFGSGSGSIQSNQTTTQNKPQDNLYDLL